MFELVKTRFTTDACTLGDAEGGTTSYLTLSHATAAYTLHYLRCALKGFLGVSLCNTEPAVAASLQEPAIAPAARVHITATAAQHHRLGRCICQRMQSQLAATPTPAAHTAAAGTAAAAAAGAAAAIAAAADPQLS